jgi:lysophospholipase L1-like esterase
MAWEKGAHVSDSIPDTKRDPDTPEDVEIRLEAREPVEDPTLGVPVEVDRRTTPMHRLVTIGDSLTHGFQSGAVFNTDLSYPAIIAYELGWYGQFRRPSYPGFGGLPLNIELLLRDLEARFGAELSFFELPLALFQARQFMDRVEDYWERGPGSQVPALAAINHNLGIYGWDLRDVLERTYERCEQEIRKPKDDLLSQIVENANQRAALRVLPSIPRAARSLTPLGAAKALGDEGTMEGQDGDGIETLIVLLGSNNALGTVTELRVVWSSDGFDDLERKKPFTIWRPTHFEAELRKVAEQVAQVRARHVIWGTVPHVTIAPIARGVAGKVEPGSRYFPFYTRPWISDRDFNRRQDPHITSQQARAIDSAIDQYNDAITDQVRAARQAGKDWYLLDVAGLLDRLAARRYIDDPLARPGWWRPYDLPPALALLQPVPDSRFLTVGPQGRISGGLFSLDGVHPTTVGYGILAQELINVMRRASVMFLEADGRTARADPVIVDFQRLIRLDTLLTSPPRTLTAGFGVLRWADEVLDVFRRTLSFNL